MYCHDPVIPVGTTEFVLYREVKCIVSFIQSVPLRGFTLLLCGLCILLFLAQESTPENIVTSLVDGCSVLRHLQHRHILQALGVYTNSQEPIMIMLAKTTFGTLKQFLDDIRLQGGPQSSYGKV